LTPGLLSGPLARDFKIASRRYLIAGGVVPRATDT